MIHRLKHTVVASVLMGTVLFSAAAAEAANASDRIPEVVYDGERRSFSVRNTEGTDLFPKFKQLMPGDQATQEICIKAENIEAPVKIYLSAGDTDLPDITDLECVRITVSANGGTVSEYPLSQAADNPDVAELDVFEQNGSCEVDVTVAVEEDAGNGLMGADLFAGWTFSAEVDTGIVTTAKTGDKDSAALYVGLGTVAAVVTICAGARKQKSCRLKR